MVVKGVGVGRARAGQGARGEQMQTIMCRMDKQGGPAVQHREICPVSWDRP